MIQKFFKKRSLREKMLLLAFLGVTLLVVVSLSLDATSNSWKAIQKSRQTLNYQSFWLKNQKSIQDQLEMALQSVNPEKTYTASKLIEFLDNQSRIIGLNYELSSPRTESADLFKIHSVNIMVRGASMKQLLDLDDKIQILFPNVILNSVLINSSRSNPALLDARVVVNSIELDPAKLQKHP